MPLSPYYGLGTAWINKVMNIWSYNDFLTILKCCQVLWVAMQSFVNKIIQLIYCRHLKKVIKAKYDNPWRRKWQPSPALLPGKSHWQRSLVGCSPWGHKESDTTKRLHFQSFHFSLSFSFSLFTFMRWRRKWQPIPVFLSGESQGQGPGRLPSMGSHRVIHDWS